MTGPTFMYGALRSGTTMFRLMPGAHEALHDPGEADFLFDHLRPAPAPVDWRYDLEALRNDRIFRAARIAAGPDDVGAAGVARLMDRMLPDRALISIPNIHRNVDRMLDVFPAARVIHLLRDPRDVARSTIGMGWAGNVYHGVDHWMSTERAWDRAAARLAPGRCLEILYEDLVLNPEETLDRTCAFLGVAPSRRMLDYHRNSTYGAPDPGLVAQWRRRLSPREIGLVESKAGDLMARRGYAPSGHPAQPPTLTERIGLSVQNRARRLGHARRTYGAPLVLAEQALRRLGARRAHRKLRLRMQEIDTRNLK